MDDNTKREVEYLSAQVRARLLFSDELRIDRKSEKPLFDKVVLEGLIRQSEKIEAQRDNLFKLIIYIVFAMFFVTNGSDFNLPVFKIKISDIPALHSLLAFGVSTIMLFYILAAVSTGAYAGLIRQFHNLSAEKNKVDPEILSASSQPTWLVFKIFETDFANYHYGAHIEPTRVTKVVNFVVRAVPVLFMLFLIIALYVYIGYFITTQVPNDIFGIMVKVISGLALFSALILSIVSELGLPYKNKLTEPVNPSAKETVIRDSLL